MREEHKKYFRRWRREQCALRNWENRQRNSKKSSKFDKHRTSKFNTKKVLKWNA